MEEMSFAGKKNVEQALRDMIGVKGDFPNDVTLVLAEFRKVCEIRHCCVHRFGKLGANNAIRLGLADHAEVLEHPFSPATANLEEIADLLRIFVKTINNFVFVSVLDRSAGLKQKYKSSQQHVKWSWKYNSDRKLFGAYYSLFASTTDVPKSLDAKTLYCSFRQVCVALKEAESKRTKGKGA